VKVGESYKPAKPELTTVTLRLPRSLMDVCRQLAAEDERSLTSQVTRMLRQWVQVHAHCVPPMDTEAGDSR
jgi:hypothetical protein